MSINRSVLDLEHIGYNLNANALAVDGIVL